MGFLATGCQSLEIMINSLLEKYLEEQLNYLKGHNYLGKLVSYGSSIKKKFLLAF